MLLLRLMGLIAPPPNASIWLRIRGFALLILLVIVLVAIGFGLAKLIALPFGGVGTLGGILLGLLIVAAVLGVLALVGRRRQARAREKQRERMDEQQAAARRIARR
jgi:membrane protein implicated in regulation of membrane protease activity